LPAALPALDHLPQTQPPRSDNFTQRLINLERGTAPHHKNVADMGKIALLNSQKIRNDDFLGRLNKIENLELKQSLSDFPQNYAVESIDSIRLRQKQRRKAFLDRLKNISSNEQNSYFSEMKKLASISTIKTNKVLPAIELNDNVEMDPGPASASDVVSPSESQIMDIDVRDKAKFEIPLLRSHMVNSLRRSQNEQRDKRRNYIQLHQKSNRDHSLGNLRSLGSSAPVMQQPKPSLLAIEDKSELERNIRKEIIADEMAKDKYNRIQISRSKLLPIEYRHDVEKQQSLEYSPILAIEDKSNQNLKPGNVTAADFVATRLSQLVGKRKSLVLSQNKDNQKQRKIKADIEYVKRSLGKRKSIALTQARSH